MTLRKKKTITRNMQPSDSDTDIEACHETTQDNRYFQIAERAYYKAEARGFQPGHELEDWIAAENEFERTY